jgi:hypothetical protein
MGLNDAERYPHIRALRVCIACCQAKDPGCLVCWDCHNDLSVVHDGGYGRVVERALQVAEVLFERRNKEDRL